MGLYKKYLTEYRSGGEFYASHVYAVSETEAKSFCRARNIGEVIIGISEESAGEKESDVFHEACFLSYICLSAGLVSIEKILGDKGIIHEMSHQESNIDSGVEWLRRITPGYCPG